MNKTPKTRKNEKKRFKLVKLTISRFQQSLFPTLLSSWMDHTDAWVRQHMMPKDGQIPTSPQHQQQPNQTQQQHQQQQIQQLHAAGNSKNLPGFGILEKNERLGFEHKLRRIFHSKSKGSTASNTRRVHKTSFSSSCSSRSTTSTLVNKNNNGCTKVLDNNAIWRSPSFYKKVSYFLKRSFRYLFGHNFQVLRRENIPYSENTIKTNFVTKLFLNIVFEYLCKIFTGFFTRIELKKLNTILKKTLFNNDVHEWGNFA